MAPTLGTVIPLIGAGGFAAAASVAGSVAGSVAIAASFGGEQLSAFFPPPCFTSLFLIFEFKKIISWVISDDR